MHFSPDDRHILVLTGNYDDALCYAKNISSDLESVLITDPKTSKSALGQEFDAVIFDMHASFDPNAFGAVSGTIRGGGFLILLRPTNFAEKSLFLKRFNQILENTAPAVFINISQDTFSKINKLPQPIIKAFSKPYATSDQERVVSAITKVVKGHRRRPLVITSDRGRGKSAALGIAAAELMKDGLTNIIICAFSKKTVSTVFQHANIELFDKEKSTLTFYSPDELNQKKPKADLVLIDEAAALPVPLLNNLLKQYSRIVFASTQHGYEGHGRGFGVNFRKVLDKETPKWKNIELSTPIRWNKDDTLEQFTYDALLLDSELNHTSIKDVTVNNCIFREISKNELLDKKTLLKQVFGLLVNAHYQTKPSDLMQLLDDDSVTIFCLENNKLIIAVSLVISEGNIDPKIIPDIFAGKRRLQGHLIAQSLSSNIGIESAPTLSGHRVSRITVHPLLQGKGFGNLLIKNLISHSTADYISTSFGATPLLISFWRKIGFSAVHLGLKRDASSGEHAVTMLYPINNNGKRLTETAQKIFSTNFPHLLSDALSSVESEVVCSILPKSSTIEITPEEKNTLRAFANSFRGYENSLYLIWKLVYEKLNEETLLNKNEAKILTIKVLQKNSWEELVKRMDGSLSGKKQALFFIRQAIKKLL